MWNFLCDCFASLYKNVQYYLRILLSPSMNHIYFMMKMPAKDLESKVNPKMLTLKQM